MNKIPKPEFRPGYLAGMVMMAAVVLLTACGGGGDGGRDPVLGGGGTAQLVPGVIAVTPQVNATGVPVNTSSVSAAFNKAMDAASITASTFTLACPSGSAMTGNVNYATSGSVATLTLGSRLPGNTVCTATVAAGVKDVAGNTLASAYVWNFTTGANPELIPPTVSSTVPVLNDTDVAVDRRITASFSEAMDPLTIIATNFSLVCPSGVIIPGSVEYTVSGNVLTFDPTPNLPFNTVCRATVGTGVKDVAGNAMVAPFGWDFTTSAAPDTTPPTVLSTLPAADATAVALNSLISATFSEAMTPATTVSATSFTVECPAATAVTGTLAYAVSAKVATFTPSASLPANTLCRATVTTDVKDLAGLAMVANKTWTFTTGPNPDLIAPMVSSTVPLNNATSTRLNTQITASFSEPMNPLTILTSNFSVQCPVGAPFTGTVSYVADGNVAVFTHATLLPAQTTCRATISTGVKDVAGNAMANPYTWNFTTGVAPDTTRPQVNLTVPLSNATGVSTNTMVTAHFTEAMDPATIILPASFTVACPVGSPVTGVVSYALNSQLATFDPTGSLPVSTLCRATVATTVRDLSGNAMLAPYVWNFTTGAAPDTTRPTVTLRNPNNGATNVPLNTAVNATFSESMDPLTIVTSNFTLANGLTPVLGQVVYDVPNRLGTFTPNASLSSGTTYTATVTNSVKDLAGNTMLVNNTWSFTTGGVLAPAAVSLGNAESFGIMATAAITSTGASQINGDVSLEPGTSQGIPPPQVSGTIHVNDATSTLARADLLTAYNELKTLPVGITVLGGTDLGASFPTGIAPGTYTSGSTMLVSTPLTLDGGGDANAIWVFQIGSSLTTTANVMLSNGAQAKNVFWVSTQDATIGVGTTFNGNIISGRDTTTQTGVVVNGRIMTGAITAGTIALDTTTVNVPAP